MSCATGGCGVGGGCGSGGGCGVGGGCSSGGCSSSANTLPVVGIQFPSTARTLHYHSGEFELELGEHCIVETDRGHAYGLVTRPTAGSDYYFRNDYPLRKVVRRATFEDRERFDAASEREREAYRFCRKRIDDRQLPMKLVNVQSALKEGKTTFFFTADGRVDFRALVRDLASKFRVRVEMRQIGVRDAAKMLGGYGDCGRPLCCSTFLKHFEPITIQMAKAQNLSLNPARISGMCGRLKCCLRYEYVPSDRKRGKRKAGGPARPERGDGPEESPGAGRRGAGPPGEEGPGRTGARPQDAGGRRGGEAERPSGRPGDATGKPGPARGDAGFDRGRRRPGRGRRGRGGRAWSREDRQKPGSQDPGERREVPPPGKDRGEPSSDS